VDRARRALRSPGARRGRQLAASDTADKIDYDDLDRVAEFATAIARRIAALDQPPAFTKVEQKMDRGGRAGTRVFTGTVPDYSTDVKGLLLSGVTLA
jgi:hypothetical protein